MQGMNRTMPLLRGLASALLITALAAAGADAATPAYPAPQLQGIRGYAFPTYFQGDSVSISPTGVVWFGVHSEGGPASLGRLKAGKISTLPLRKKGALGSTYSTAFAPTGALWFGIEEEGSSGRVRYAIGRRAPSGAVTRTALPAKGPVNWLTVGPEGDAWFTSGSKARAAMTRMAPTGAATRFSLPAGTPGSVAAGPDGAIWFAEKQADGSGVIGRIATDGTIQQYTLGAGVVARRLVAGPDGALWFSENGAATAGGASADRIGRITTSGEVAQFPIPFGTSTVELAADPAGRIWFTTEAGELSSISTTGALGGRGCLGQCDRPIVALAVAPSGVLWFAAGNASCTGCGGSASLMAEDAGSEVGEIPAGALTPAPVAP